MLSGDALAEISAVEEEHAALSGLSHLDESTAAALRHLGDVSGSGWCHGLDVQGSAKLIHAHVPISTTSELWDDLFDKGGGKWLSQILEGLSCSLAPGTRVTTLYRDHRDNIRAPGIGWNPVPSNTQSGKEAMAFYAPGLQLDPANLHTGLDPGLLQSLRFLTERANPGGLVIVSSHGGRTWLAQIEYSGEGISVNGVFLDTTHAPIDGTLIVRNGLHHRLTRDWHRHPRLCLDMDSRYPNAKYADHNNRQIDGPVSKFEVNGHEHSTASLETVLLDGGAVECLNLDHHPKARLEWYPQRTLYSVGDKSRRSLAVDGRKRDILPSNYGSPDQVNRRALMDWNLKGKAVNQGGSVGRKRKVLMIQQAIRRLQDPTMIRLLIERMLAKETDKSPGDHPIAYLELEELPPELRDLVGPITPETAQVIRDVWWALFGKMFIARDQEEALALKKKYPYNQEGEFMVCICLEPIPDCFPEKDKVDHSLAKVYRDCGFSVGEVIRVDPEVYAFLSEAGVPTAEQVLDGTINPEEEEAPIAVADHIEVTLGFRPEDDDSRERQFLVIELDPGISQAAARLLADQAAASTGGHVAALTLPEATARRVLLSPDQPYAYLGDAGNIVHATASFLPAGAPNPLTMTPPPRVIEMATEDPATPDEPEPTPPLKKKISPVFDDSLPNENEEDPNLLANREGIDVEASHMPQGYYAKTVGTRFTTLESGRSAWEHEDIWEECEVAADEPDEFETRIVMPTISGDTRLLVRPEDEIIACTFEGGPVQLHRDPNTGLYMVRGEATNFRYWTAREEDPARFNREALDCESELPLELGDLPATAQEWIGPLLEGDKNALKALLDLKAAWEQHFKYDSRVKCRGEDEAAYVHNLFDVLRGNCSEAGEGIALLCRLAGFPTHVYGGYWHGSDNRIGSHRWARAKCGDLWMHLDGVEGVEIVHSSITLQSMPNVEPVTQQIEEPLVESLAKPRSGIRELATRQNAARAGILAAVLATAAGIFGAGMWAESKLQIFGGNAEAPAAGQ